MDSTSLDELEAKALAIEEGMEIARDAERKPKEPPRPQSGPPRNDNRRTDRGPSGNPNRDQPRPQRSGAPGTGSSRPAQTSTRGNNQGPKPAYAPRQESRADQDRKKHLRDEGKCFLCESSQHLARDCPQVTQKRPPAGLHSMALGMMSPVEVRLAALDKGSNLGLFGMAFGASTSSTSWLEERDELWEVVLTTVRQALPLPFDRLDETIDEAFAPDRFSIVEYGGRDSYLLSNKHNRQDHTLYKSQLINPEFDLITYLIQAKDEFYEGLAAS